MHVSRWLAASATILAICAALARAQTKPPTKFTIDDLVRIKHPSGHQWTPDGRHVWWTYDDGGVNNVWAAAADGSGQPVQLTKYPDGQTGVGGFWSPDGQTFLPARGGLQAVSPTGGDPARRRPSAAARERVCVVAPDGSTVVFIVGQGGGLEVEVGEGAVEEGRMRIAARANVPSAGADPVTHALAGDKDQRRARRFRGAHRRRVMVAGTARGSPTRRPPAARLSCVASLAAEARSPSSDARADQRALVDPDGANLRSFLGGGGWRRPIQHSVPPPEIGPKLISRRKTARQSRTTFPCRRGRFAEDDRPWRRRFRRGGARGWRQRLAGQHAPAERVDLEQRQDAYDGVGRHQHGRGEDASRGNRRQVLQRGERDPVGYLPRSQVGALHGRHERMGPDLCGLEFRRDSSADHEDTGRALARGVVARQQAHRVGHEHVRQARARQIEFATIADDPAKATITVVTRQRHEYVGAMVA